jgi:hypothetical protein
MGNSALLVESDPHLLEAITPVLSFCGASVVMTCTPHAIYSRQLSVGEPGLFVLSDALGSLHLRAVAEQVRRRWGRSKILVIGPAIPMLDDPLYDESVPASFSQTEFLRAVRRCSFTSTWADDLPA